jgi:hypothetical protein
MRPSGMLINPQMPAGITHTDTAGIATTLVDVM